MDEPIRACTERDLSTVVTRAAERAALVLDSKWPLDSVIRVGFLEDEGSQAIRKRVADASKGWLKYATRVTFSFVEDPASAPVRIAFSYAGSWSVLGTQCRQIAKTEPTMNFGWLTDESSDDEVSRVVLHEFGHMLGLIHEHQNPQGGIPWNKPAVYAYYERPPNNWSKEDVDRNMFDPYDADVTKVRATPVDRDSIMMYPIPKAFTIGGAFEVGMNTTLSSTDKKFVHSIYS
jgi:hypothetical protein